MSRLFIVGASGHGRVVADAARLSGWDDIAFLDDNPRSEEVSGFPILGRSDSYDVFSDDDACIVAIGNAATRNRVQTALKNHGVRMVSIVHPDAVIAHDVILGEGSAVLAGAVINTSARIGCGTIINTCASVDHDCVVSDYAHISVGAHLAGTVCIGSYTWVGIGAVVSNNISICANCMIGAGAVVIGDIDGPGTYVGVPARCVRRVQS